MVVHIVIDRIADVRFAVARFADAILLMVMPVEQNIIVHYNEHRS